MTPLAAPVDPWADWLLGRRQGGAAAPSGGDRERLERFRDTVLTGAAIRAGDTVLDLGCGDGLIGLAALERVGATGTVIFTDISERLLAHCRARADELGLGARCRFLTAPADDLSALADASVDVVTDRSVLIYVADKARAFSEIHRVLRRGGRLSLFEPVNRFKLEQPCGSLGGYDLGPLGHLADRVAAAFACNRDGDNPMLDADERDLVRFADRAGFAEVAAHLVLSLTPAFAQDPAMLLRSAPNPLSPTLDEAIAQTLTAEEAEWFRAAFTDAVLNRRGRIRFAGCHLRARKD